MRMYLPLYATLVKYGIQQTDYTKMHVRIKEMLQLIHKENLTYVVSC